MYNGIQKGYLLPLSLREQELLRRAYSLLRVYGFVRLEALREQEGKYFIACSGSDELASLGSSDALTLSMDIDVEARCT